MTTLDRRTFLSALSAAPLVRIGSPRRRLVLLHGHVLDQTSMYTHFSDQQDTEENRARGQRKPDRCVVYTVVLKLSRGGATSMRILGQGDVIYEAQPGTDILFLSELWHRTETATPGTMKVALFFGVWC